MPDTIQVTEDYVGLCPTCQAKIIFDLEAGSVFHAMPMCNDFVTKDALEFARFVREDMERRARALPKIEVAGDLEGQGHIGFKRKDIPIFHTIVRAPQGERFTLDGHFDKCEICKAHGVMQHHFDAFMVLNMPNRGSS